jgi:hypothetical protein
LNGLRRVDRSANTPVKSVARLWRGGAKEQRYEGFLGSRADVAVSHNIEHLVMVGVETTAEPRRNNPIKDGNIHRLVGTLSRSARLRDIAILFL